MSLVDRGDEESQVKGENNATYQEAEKSSNLGTILKIVGVVIIVLAIIGYIFYPKVSTYGTLYIDNPTENDVLVKIGDLNEINVVANSHQELDLKPGTYAVSVNNENVGEFNKKAMDGKSFLNPTQSTYILEEAVYMLNTAAESPTEDYTIVIDEVEYYGPFKVFSDLYIVGDWTYGLDEVLPDEVTIASYDTKDYAIRKKIYRVNDFIDMYDVYYY